MSMRDADKPTHPHSNTLTDRDLEQNDMMHAHVNSLKERSMQSVGISTATRTATHTPPIEAMFDAEGRLEGAVEELVSLIDQLLGEPTEKARDERFPADSVAELLTSTPKRMDTLGMAIGAAAARLRGAFL